MKNNRNICTICRTPIKQLKHSSLCACGIKIKTKKAIS